MNFLFRNENANPPDPVVLFNIQFRGTVNWFFRGVLFTCPVQWFFFRIFENKFTDKQDSYQWKKSNLIYYHNINWTCIAFAPDNGEIVKVGCLLIRSLIFTRDGNFPTKGFCHSMRFWFASDSDVVDYRGWERKTIGKRDWNNKNRALDNVHFTFTPPHNVLDCRSLF